MFVLEIKGRRWWLLCISITCPGLTLQPHEFSWPLLPSPRDGEPQVLREPSLSGCIQKAVLPPPASAMKHFPPRVVIMKCHRGNSWNIICACLLFPHPSSPPTSLLTFWSYVCCTRKKKTKHNLSPILPPNFQRGLSVPCGYHDKKKMPPKGPWYLVATLNLPKTRLGVTAVTRTSCLPLSNNTTSVKWHYKEALSQ